MLDKEGISGFIYWNLPLFKITPWRSVDCWQRNAKTKSWILLGSYM